MKKEKTISIVVAVSAIVAAVMVIILNRTQPISDDYFVSDDTKMVMALDATQAAYEESEYEPEWTYVVYHYDGDKIVGAEIYFAYDSDEAAKEADEYVNLGDKEWAYKKELNGKYIVFKVRSGQYADLTSEYVRGIINR